MNKAFRSIKQKWINTRFSKPYKERLLWARIKCAMTLHQAIFNISMIRSTKVETKEQAIEKSIAIANTVVNSIEYVTNTFKEAKR